MSAQHTPGPWEMDEAGSWKDGNRTSVEYFVRLPGDDVAIASDIIDPGNGDKPSKANATLIAAAPDLLKALESLLAEYEDRKAQWGDEYLWDKHEHKEVIESAKTAIAKAKVEQP